MNFNLDNTDIIIYAKEHNPSILSKEWLSRKNIIKETEIKNFAHTPVFSIIETDLFNLMVEYEMLNMTIKKIDEENIKQSLKFLKKYTSSLPETPYKTLNFIFKYKIKSNQKHLRKLFVKKDDLFNKIFPNDYEVGGIIEYKINKFTINVMFIPRKQFVTAGFNCILEIKNFSEIEIGLNNYFKIKNQIEKTMGDLF